MRYPIAIELGDDQHAYGVIVPDLPGCFSAGDTLDEAIANSEEAILLFLEDQDAPAARPSTLETLRDRAEFNGLTWAVANVDMSKLSTKAVRINVTVPDRVLAQIDSFATKHGETRSGFLTRAAVAAMAECA
jgi:predicted RNase H-like HicB family nuclease